MSKHKKSSYSISIISAIFGAIMGIFIGSLMPNKHSLIKLQDGEICAWFTEPKMFRPIGFIDCETKIINLINNAQENIYVQSYSWTSIGIAKALINAAKRNVKVQVILDKENESHNSTAMNLLVSNGIEVRIRRINGISHNKVMLFDNKVVITGSYNFTQAANEKNDENIMVVYNKAIAEQYIKNWQKCYKYTYPVGSNSFEEQSIPWSNRGYKVNNRYKSPLDYIETAEHSIYIVLTNEYVNFLDHEVMNYLISAQNRGIIVKIYIYSNSKTHQQYNLSLPIKYIQKKSNKSYILIDNGTELDLNWSDEKNRYVISRLYKSHAKAARLEKLI